MLCLWALTKRYKLCGYLPQCSKPLCDCMCYFIVFISFHAGRDMESQSTNRYALLSVQWKSAGSYFT